MANATLEIVPTSGDIQEKTVEFTAGSSLSEVLRLSRMRFGEKTRAFINGKATKETAKVPDDAKITIIEPVTGA